MWPFKKKTKPQNSLPIHCARPYIHTSNQPIRLCDYREIPGFPYNSIIYNGLDVSLEAIKPIFAKYGFNRLDGTFYRHNFIEKDILLEIKIFDTYKYHVMYLPVLWQDGFRFEIQLPDDLELQLANIATLQILHRVPKDVYDSMSLKLHKHPINKDLK